MKIIKILITLILSNLILAASAQPGQRVRDKIEAQKVAFITERLNLSVEEAQKFWPLYNEFNDKRNKILQQRQEKIRNYRFNKEQMTEGEIEEAGDYWIESKLLEAKLSKQYHLKFKAILPNQKVIEFYQAEVEFKSWLVKKIRERRNN